MKQESGVFTAGKILTLIGAIWQTIICAIILILFCSISLFGLILPVYNIVLGIYSIFVLPFVILIWVARTKAVKHRSTGWTIYGLVQSIVFADICGVVGYVMLLLDNSQRLDDQAKQNRNEPSHEQYAKPQENEPQFTSNQRYYDITPTEEAHVKNDSYVDIPANTNEKTQEELEMEIENIKRKIAALQQEEAQK